MADAAAELVWHVWQGLQRIPGCAAVPAGAMCRWTAHLLRWDGSRARRARFPCRLSGVMGVGCGPPGQLLPAVRWDPGPGGPPCRRRGPPGAHRPHRAGQRPLAGASGSSRSRPPPSHPPAGVAPLSWR
eukprot:3788966-Pyramimonas_sp.AAC.1